MQLGLVCAFDEFIVSRFVLWGQSVQGVLESDDTFSFPALSVFAAGKRRVRFSLAFDPKPQRETFQAHDGVFCRDAP